MIKDEMYGNGYFEEREGRKRQYKRIRKQFILRFKIRSGPDHEEVHNGWDMVTLKDLSAGGILFNYNEEIEIGTIIDIKLNFPMSKVPIICTGKIIRNDKIPHISLVRVAAVFLDIDDNMKELVKKAAEGFYSVKEDVD